jgi:hypothetical protein
MIESTKPKYLSMSANCIFRLLNLIFQLQKYSHCECANFGRFEMKKKKHPKRDLVIINFQNVSHMVRQIGSIYGTISKSFKSIKFVSIRLKLN